MTRIHRTLSASLLAFAACGGSAPVAPDAPTSPVPDLAGRWGSGCIDPGSGSALRLTFGLTATAWALDYESFADAACQVPVLQVHIDGPYSITRPSPSVAGAYEGRFAFAQKTVTPASADAVSFLEQACGGGTFAVGVASDLSAGCAGLGAYPIASCPADFDLVARAGDLLQFGERPGDNNMCTEDRRPTALSPVQLVRM
jgi:hypothetical protein